MIKALVIWGVATVVIFLLLAMIRKTYKKETEREEKTRKEIERMDIPTKIILTREDEGSEVSNSTEKFTLCYPRKQEARKEKAEHHLTSVGTKKVLLVADKPRRKKYDGYLLKEEVMPLGNNKYLLEEGGLGNMCEARRSHLNGESTKESRDYQRGSKRHEANRCYNKRQKAWAYVENSWKD